jgi:hypothetical protein
MHRFVTTLLCTVLLAGLAAPAAESKTRVAIGMGDQSPRIFTAKKFKKLKVKKVRYFIRWDAKRIGWARAQADAYVKAARKARKDVFMHISTNNYEPREAKLPSVKKYKKFVGWIVRRYKRMGVKTWGVWNEANHYTQPTYRNPKRAGQYFKQMRRMCRGCKIVALDILDQRGSASYIRRFYRKLSPSLRRKANLVGIHNYADTNRFRMTGTKEIIRAVKRHNRRANFWLTETGGIVNLGRSFPCSTTRAAKAIKYMFRVAKRYRRDIDRLYAYNFYGTQPSCNDFDAGLLTWNGKKRKGYGVFKYQARKFTR